MGPAKKTIEIAKNVHIPTIGLGTWQSPHEEVKQAVKAAISAGYRHIDTAYVYGNEAAIGEALSEVLKSGQVKREELFVVTKLPSIGMHREQVRPFIERSLKNLQLDYVDLYLIHTPFGFKFVDFATLGPKDEAGNLLIDKQTNHVEIWKGMEEVHDAGLAKAIGVSNFKIDQIERVLKNCRVKPANLQIEVHAYFQQRPLIDFCKKNGISVCAFSPFGSPGLGDFEKKFNKNRSASLPKILDDPTVNAIAKKHGKGAGHILLRFLIEDDIIVIPKSVTPSRIADNLNVYDFELTNEDKEQLRALDKNLRFNYLNIAADTHLHPEYPFEQPPTA